MSRHPGYDQKPRYRYAVISGEQSVIDQGDPHDSKWMQAGGDARDRGRMVELISKSLTGSERMMVGLAWFEPGDVHLLHHHPHADKWYYVIDGSALFTVGGDLIRGTAGTAMFIPAGVPHRIEKPRQPLTASSARLSMPIRSQITLFVITDHFTLAKGIRRCHVPAQLFASPAREPRERPRDPSEGDDHVSESGNPECYLVEAGVHSDGLFVA